MIKSINFSQNQGNNAINLNVKIADLEKLNNLLSEKLDKNNNAIKNKIEQNNAMIDLLKVQKQEIALLVNCLNKNNLYTGEIANKLKEFKIDEHKALNWIKRIAEEQNSESEVEIEGKFFIHLVKKSFKK